MFKKSVIEVFMGGQFDLNDISRECTVKELADELQKWVNEIRLWDDAKHDVKVAEAAIVKDRLLVTLKDGIPQ